MTFSLLKARSCGRSCAVLLSECTDPRDLSRLLSPRYGLFCERVLHPADLSFYSPHGKDECALDLTFALCAYLQKRYGASRYECEALSARMRGERLSLSLRADKISAPAFSHRASLGARILPFDLLSIGHSYAVSFYHGLPLSRVPLTDWGTRVSHMSSLPLRTRAVFCEVTAKNALSLRIWDCEEGELASSITAAAAALHLSLLRGMLRTGVTVTVRTRGGVMTLSASGTLGETAIDAEGFICFRASVEL